MPLHELATPSSLQETTLTRFCGNLATAMRGWNFAFHAFDFLPSLVVTVMSTVCSTTPVKVLSTVPPVRPGYHHWSAGEPIGTSRSVEEPPGNGTKDLVGKCMVIFPAGGPKFVPVT